MRQKKMVKMGENEVRNEDSQLIAVLEKVPVYESADIEDVIEWMANDEDEEFTDEVIVEIVTNKEPVNEKIEDDKPNKISHTESFNVIEAALSTSANKKRRCQLILFAFGNGKTLLQGKVTAGKAKNIKRFFLN